MRGAIGLVLAILGCIGAWKKNPGLLFIVSTILYLYAQLF